MRKGGALLGLLLGTSILGTGSLQAEEITLRVHHFLPTSSITHKDFLEPWGERIEAQSDGRIAVEIYPAMQLGGRPPQLYDQARDGIADVVWTLPGYTPGRFPLIGLFELPFMVSTAEATSQALEVFARKHLMEEFADVHPLLFHVHGRGSLHLRGEEVETMEDLDGLRIRAPSRVIGDALEALGASPVFLPVPQVPEALSRGVIDGAMLPFEVSLPLRVPELATSHTEIAGPRGFYTATFLLAMNKSRYESLPPDLKAVIDANSGVELAREIGRLWDEAEEPGREAGRENGNSFKTLSDEEVQRWRTAVQPVIDTWVAEVEASGADGAALLEEARTLIRTYSEE